MALKFYEDYKIDFYNAHRSIDNTVKYSFYKADCYVVAAAFYLACRHEGILCRLADLTAVIDNADSIRL